LFVGGLSPSLSTTTTLDMGMGRTDDRATVNVFAGGAWLVIRLLDGTPTDDLVITSYYYNYVNPTLHSATSVTPDVGLSDGGRFTITVVSNCVGRTNTIYLNGVEKLTTPYTRYKPYNLTSVYDPFVNPFIYFEFASIYSGQTAYLQLYSIEQTVPKYSYITPVSNPKLISFGVDGPHAWDTVDTGLSLLDHGTIWADVKDIGRYSTSEMAALKALIADGFELGIHFSSRLSDLPLADAITLMNAETASITAVFGEPPTSWSSLQGADNITHAEYAYTNLEMVSRNGVNGSAGGLSQIANLADNCWTFWSKASAAGIVIPSFSHELDVTPAITWSISPANFSTFVSNYASNGIQIVGFREYWEKAQNSYHTVVSNVVSDPGVSLSFTVENIGGKSRLLVNAPWADVVRDSSGANVPFEAYGSGIVVEVEDGDYTVAAVGAAPRADFSADKTAVVVGQSIQFTNLSSGGIAPFSYQWDFDNDGTWDSTDENPTYAYSAAGTYTVVLKITDSDLSTDAETKANYITVNQPLSVTTSPPTAVTDSSAILNGYLASLGSASSTQVSFEWGLTTSYGSTTVNAPKTASGGFSANLTGLTAGTAYHFRAKAVGNGTAYGSDVTFTTISGVPAAPTLYSPANGAHVSGTSVTFQWNASPGATKYFLIVSTSPSLSTTQSNSSVRKYWGQVNGTQYTVTGFPNNGTTYYWWVYAGNSSGWSSQAQVAANGGWSLVNGTGGGTPTVPAAPTLYSPANGANVPGTSVAFQWNASLGATKYFLMVSTNSSLSVSQTNSSVRKYWGQVNDAQYTVTGFPNNGTTYYWWVYAGNSSGWSSQAQVAANGGWSLVNGTGGGTPTVPAAPTLLSPANGAHVSGTSVTFQWNASLGATKYFLIVSTNSSLSVSQTNSSVRKYWGQVNGTQYTVTGFPNNGTTYYWWVYAGNSSGWSTQAQVVASGGWSFINGS
jgi:PKD repeat protein